MKENTPANEKNLANLAAQLKEHLVKFEELRGYL